MVLAASVAAVGCGRSPDDAARADADNPAAIGTSGQVLDNFDVIVVDGLPAPGYRPTRSDQVTTDPSGPLAGTTRLREVPLLADTGSSGSPPSLNADIDWQCDPLP